MLVSKAFHNKKALLFMVASGTILIEHEIFDPEKGTSRLLCQNYS